MHVSVMGKHLDPCPAIHSTSRHAETPLVLHDVTGRCQEIKFVVYIYGNTGVACEVKGEKGPG